MKTLLILLALLPFAQAQAMPRSSVLLAEMCEPGAIKGAECTKLKNTPSDASAGPCSITIAHVYEGRFLSASSTLVVADYDNSCEPHVNSWGGAAYFKKAGNGYVLAGLQPGARYPTCLLVPSAVGQRDRLVCETGFTGQGYTEATISEVHFAQSYTGDVSAQYDVLVNASSNGGALGSESVDCPQKEFPHLISVGLPAQKPAGPYVNLEVEYADEALARKACLKPYSKKDIADGTGRSNMAPLPSVHTGVFTLNLDTRELKQRP